MRALKLIEMSMVFPHGYPETLEGPRRNEGSNGSMKPCAKNNVWAEDSVRPTCPACGDKLVNILCSSSGSDLTLFSLRM
jgi:hypothetical protein